MPVYYALIHVADNGRHSFIYGDHDMETVDDHFIQYRETQRAEWLLDNVATLKVVTLPADNLLAAYLDRQNAGIDDASPVAAIDEQGKQVGLYKSQADAERLKPGHTYRPAAAARQSSETAFDEALTEAIGEEVKLANDRIQQHAAAAPAKPIAPAGTLVGTVPANYPYMDKHGLDAAGRHKMQFDTVTAEGIAAIPEIDVTPNQIRYAGDIGAIYVDRRSIPFRYRFTDVLEYIAARDAGDKPATVAERHAKARQ